MGKVSEHFYTEDFVSPAVYKQWGESSLWYMDYEMIVFTQQFRLTVGKPVLVNNWKDGGAFVGSGFRDTSVKEFRPFSQHSFGRAVDIKVGGLTSHEMVEVVRKYRDKWPWITTYENPDQTISKDKDGKITGYWLHVDKRRTGIKDLFMVNPLG